MKRRALLGALGVAALSGCGSLRNPNRVLGDPCDDAPAPAAADSEWWPMADHDAGAGGSAPTGVDEPGETVWSLSTAGEDVYLSAPTVTERGVYLGRADFRDLPGSTSVLAYDHEGAERWTVDASYTHVGQPAVDAARETVYVVSGQDESNTGPGKGEVLALDPETGERRWRTGIGKRLDGAPVPVDGAVYVRSDSQGVAGVYALDAGSGERRWFFPTGEVLHDDPTVVGDTVLTSRDREELVAVDAADGTERWAVAVGGDETRPVVGDWGEDDGVVFVGANDHLVARCLADGHARWRWNPEDGRDDGEAVTRTVRTTPALVDGTLVAHASGRKPFRSAPDLLAGFDPGTGKRRWRHEFEDIGRPVGVGDAVVAAVNRDTVAFDAETGSERWRRGDVASVRAAADGRLYLGDRHRVAVRRA